MNTRTRGLITTLVLAPVMTGCDQFEQGKRILDGVSKAMKDPGTTTLINTFRAIGQIQAASFVCGKAA